MKIEGLERLKSKIKSIPQEIRAPVSQALAEWAEEMTQFQRAAVPVGPPDAGTLRDSIRWEFGGSGRKGEILGNMMVTVRAGGPTTTRAVRAGAKATYDYALAQEFGTQKMTANPFFWPGYRLTKKRGKARISRACTKALKAAANK